MRRPQASGPAPGRKKMAEGERQSPPGRTCRRGRGGGAGAVPGAGAGEGCGAGGSSRRGAGVGGSGDRRTRWVRGHGPRGRTGVEGPCGRSGEGPGWQSKNPGLRRFGGWRATPGLRGARPPEGRVGSALARGAGLGHVRAALGLVGKMPGMGAAFFIRPCSGFGVCSVGLGLLDRSPSRLHTCPPLIHLPLWEAGLRRFSG